jgi:hypothetical protein
VTIPPGRVNGPRPYIILIAEIQGGFRTRPYNDATDDYFAFDAVFEIDSSATIPPGRVNGPRPYIILAAEIPGGFRTRPYNDATDDYFVFIGFSLSNAHFIGLLTT